MYKYSTGSKAQETAQYWKDRSSVKDSDEIYGDIINIASKLKTYSLSYYNYNSVTKTEKNIKYTAPLKSYANYTPARPSGLPEYYVFGGWYKDKACTTKFDFNTEKMPNANVQIYAKWTAKKINLTYNLNTPDGTSKKVNGDVAAGTIASDVLPSIPTVDEYSFAGWYVADENDHMTTVAFNANAAILKDTNVIGKWLYNGKLTVKYVADGVKAPEDNNVYAGGAKATVANGVKKEGKKFLGWQLDGGNVYQPGQNFEVNKDLADDKNVITLTAVFGDSETSAILTYHPGNGNGKDQSDAILNNGVVTLKNTSDLSYTAPGEDYYFAGWATSMGDAQKGNATYAAGQSVHVDVDGENVLYATWIEKTVITLVANSNTVTYNGQSQEVNGFQSLTIDGYIVSGLNAHAQGTNVGTYPTEITGTAHVEKDNEDVTNKVVVETTLGQLTITKKSIVPDDSNGIVVDAPKGSKYDGEKHENEPVVTDTKTDKTLVKGIDYTLTYSEDVINVGTVTVTITGTGNYEGTVDTSYEITPRKVIMTSADGSKVYDGSALTKNKVTESEDGFVKDDGATYNVTGNQTDTGSSKNTFTYTLNEKTLKKNYVIETKEGTLEVTPVIDKVVVEIKGKTKTETYNGNTHEVEGYDVTNISNALYPEEAIHFKGTAKASRKEEGTSYMGLNVSQFSNTSSNFTNVTFRVTDGWLKVTPKSIDPKDEKTGIQVTKPSDTMYNGEEQKNKPTVEDTKTSATLVENVDYTLSYTAAVNAGTVEVTITGIGNYTGTAKTSYEITKRNVTLTSASASKPYDKTPLTNKNVTIAGFGFVKEEGAIYYVTGSQTEKGTSKNTFTYELKSNTKASNYTIKVVYGDLTVTAEDGEVVVVITGCKDTFEYDGTEKSVKGYDVSITEGSTYLESDFTFSGNDEVKGTEAGTYDMGLKPKDFTNNNENYGNVTFRVLDGQLTIVPKSITPDGPETPEEKKTGIEVTEPEDSKYDGEEHKNTPTVADTKTGKTLTEGTDYTLTYSEDVTNAGKVTVTVTGIGNYTGEFDVTYEITKRDVVLTSATDSKPYDGTALRNENVEVTGDGFAASEGATFAVTGTITNVGTKANTFGYALNKNTLASNYNISTELGTLTITPKSIIPDGPKTPEDKKTGITVENPGDVKYDGKDHAEKPVIKDEKTGVTLEEGKDYEIVYPEDIKNAGEITATVVGKGDYEGSFEIKYNITKRDVTFTSATDSKQYDGNALTNGNVEITGDGFIEGEGAEYKVIGTQTQVGNSANEFEYTLNENTLASNYDITKVVGTLTVTAAPAPETPEKPKPEVKKSVDTSDDNNTVFYGNAFFMAMITLAGIIVLRKKSS